MRPTLETLNLRPDELAAARDAVRTMAYYKWIEAGSPVGDGAPFWIAAEAEWIEHDDVPHRHWDDAFPEAHVAHVGKKARGARMTRS